MATQKSILVIDDDPDVLSSLRSTLESSSYQVVTALSGEEGYNKFKDEKPALIICDIMMEQISTGIDTVKKMRAEDKDVKIYILSDIGSLTASNIDVYKLGANGILQKPINPDELLKIVKQAV
jgi:DNA-binding response OmpR family regulator